MAKLIFIRNLSVKNKITFIILFIAFTVISVGFLFISIWDIKKLKTEIQSHLALDATLIGNYCIVPIVFGDREQASDALSRLKFIESVEEGYLIDNRGELFAFYPKDLKPGSVGSMQKESTAVFRDRFFYITEPVVFKNEVIGTLFIRANSDLLVKQNKNLALILSSVFIGMLLISYLLAFRLQKLITTPILNLAKQTQNISETHDYNIKLEYPGKDEVGTLYNQFNNMLQQISLRQNERDIAENQLKTLNTKLSSELTERKVIEESLRSSEERYRYLFQRNPASMAIYEPVTLDLLAVNDAFISQYGYSQEEALSMNLPDFYPDNEKGPIVDLVRGLKGITYTGEWHHIKKDGTVVGIITTSHDISYMGKNARIVVITDISDRLKAEKEASFLAQVLKNINECVSITEVDNKILFVNQSWLKNFEYTEEEVIGKKIDIIVSPVNRQGIIEEILSETLKGGWQGELINRRKNGSEFPVMLFTTIIYDKEKKPFALVGISTDISEQKKIRDELIKHQGQLENLVAERTEKLRIAVENADKANQAKSEFLANMSHEIRTPMNAVLGYTELLSAFLTEPTQKNYIESIKSSGRSLLTLINDILDLSKIEAGRLELEYDYIDSNNFFNEFERIFALKASEKAIKFIVEIASGTPAGIYVDEPRLRQIVFNLIGNALKFTNKGFVKLKVYTDNLQVVKFSEKKTEEFIDLIIEVEDTGIGISKELREEIFDPFVQARDQKNIGGTGLGLAITRRLTSLMNGSISLKSELGKGTTFTVRIPGIAFKREFFNANIMVRINPEDIIFEKSTLLIVDDIEHNRSFIRDTLKNTKIEVIEAEDGFQALKLAKEILPDIIISDIRMPNMDGFQLLEKLKAYKKTKSIPVLAYSASVLKDQKERIHQSEFAALLIKPINISDLYLELINFLPYSETKKSKPDLSHEKEVFQIENPEKLVEILENELLIIWKSFEVRQPIGEIKMFGERLVSLGMIHKATLITEYGKELKTAADSFDIEAILSLLKQYNAIIEKIKI
jgi:PAS domain S-box-containing protein